MQLRIRNLLLASVSYLAVALGDLECEPRDFGHGSIVCVCNSTYCDTIDRKNVSDGEAVIYTSTKAGQRFHVSTASASDHLDSSWKDITLTVTPSKKYQEMLGFGGAFTDAAGINFMALPLGARKNLLKSYFSTEGIEYSIGRIPIASCDFSTRVYSYDDVSGDYELAKFALAKEDTKYKIPIIQQALTLSPHKMKLFGSAWAAPGWMKTTGKMEGGGFLKGKPGGKTHKTWAKYLRRFVESYEVQSIPIWAVSTGNEPSAGYIPGYTFQAMGWSPTSEADFVKNDLGPALEPTNTTIIVLDDDRLTALPVLNKVFGDSKASPYVVGGGVHWYSNNFIPGSIFSVVHRYHPDKLLFGSEACNGVGHGPSLGSWEYGEAYASDILTDVYYWHNGWTDWNLALDMQGGPNWVKNFVDAPVIVNSETGEFYKQPMFYAMGHFRIGRKILAKESDHEMKMLLFLAEESQAIAEQTHKFVQPGSHSVEIKASRYNMIARLNFAAFEQPGGNIAVVILNEHNAEQTCLLKLTTGEGLFRIPIEARSIKTVLVKQ